MKPNELIRARREGLGLSPADVAMTASLGIPAYRDIEAYEDEAFTRAHLQALRSICEMLGLDLLSIFGIECQFCSGDYPDALFHVARNALISQRRMALGLTDEQLGDRIGFEAIAIEKMEKDPDFLELWSVELIQQLATELGIPVHALLRVRCLKCGHGVSGR